MAALKIGNNEVRSTSEKVYIIAEIGQNHQGSLDIAKKMISKAKECGCDCVKFQKSCLDAKFTKKALNRPYTDPCSFGKTYGEHKAHLEFTLEQHMELQAYSKHVGIDFTASAMDEVSLEQVNSLNVPFIKIGSGDANNLPLLKKAACLECPLIISTGMQSMSTIQKIVQIMETAKKTNFALLHCVSSYPTEPIDCNLQIIRMLQLKFPYIMIGYSGHEQGIDISKAAYLLGARIIERHFTLDKNLKGSDHKCSLLPEEMLEMIIDIKALSFMPLYCGMGKQDILYILGHHELVRMALKDVKERSILPCEISCRRKLGKSIVARRKLKCGDILQEDSICIKVSEPIGISAECYDTLLGTILNADVEEDEPLLDIHISKIF